VTADEPKGKRPAGATEPVPLSRVATGRKGTVAFLRPATPERMAELLALGFLPGESIEVIRTFPSFVFRIGHSQYAVDKEIASEIFLRLDPARD